MSASEQALDPVAKFREWRDAAIIYTRQKEYAQALDAVAVAAYFLHAIAPPPFPVDPSLEACLLKIADALKKDYAPPAGAAAKNARPRVAHVVSMLRDGGGHTSFYLGFLGAHDRSAFDVKGYVLDDIVENMAAHEEAKTSSNMAPDTLKKCGNVPIEFFPAEATRLKKVKLLLEKIAADRIDLVVVHGIPWDVISIVAARLNRQTKFVYLHVADGAFNLGPDMFDLHVDFFRETKLDCARHVNPSRHVLIPGLCDPLTRDAAEAAPYRKEELGFRADDVLIGTFGALHKVIRPITPVFLHMMKQLLERDPRFHYILIGTRPGAMNVEEVLVRFLGAETARRVHVYQPREDFLRVMKTLDLYINGFPVSGGCIVLEAMAAGIPMLAATPIYDTQYLTYTVDIGVEEVFAPPEEIAGKAIAILSDPEKRKTLGELMKKRFDEALSPRKVVAQYEELFKSLFTGAYSTAIS